jgi:hypothetical protein
VGKTTLSRLIADRAEWTVLGEAAVRIDPPASLRVDTPADLLRVERRLLREERRRCRTATRLREEGLDVLLDTGPFGPATYSLGMAAREPKYASAAVAVVDEVLDDLRAGRMTVPDRVVYLTASEAALRARAERSRQDHPVELMGRHRDVGRIERAFWAQLARRSSGSVLLLPSRGPPAADARRLLARLALPTPRLPARLLRSQLRQATRDAGA